MSDTTVSDKGYVTKLVDNGDGSYSPLVSAPAYRTVQASPAAFGTAHRGELLAAATLSTNLTGSNNDLTFTAVTQGEDGNDITIAYVDPGTPSASLSVDVNGTAITVNLATNGSSVITSTAAEVDAAIDAKAEAAALVTPADKAANDGSGVVTALAATALSGGADGYKTLFTVTGAVLAKVIGFCTTNLAGASATVSVGTALTNAGLITTTTGTNIDTNEIWHDATPDASIELSSVAAEKILFQDIREYVATAAVTSGQIYYVCLWTPLTPDGSVVAA